MLRLKKKLNELLSKSNLIKKLRKITSFFFKKRSLNVHPRAWTNLNSSWQETLDLCSGYDNPEILEKCKKALLKVKNGEAVYERDSVIFDEIQYSFGLLSGLLKVAVRNKGALNVLDFGGSLGSTYFQNKLFLDDLKVSWDVVEQSNFVDCGKANFENDILKFHYSFDECLSNTSPHVIVASNVLQYIEHIDDVIGKINFSQVQFIILDSVSFNKNNTEQIVKQTVPNNIYNASYPMHVFVESDFIKKLKNYSVLTSFESYCAPKTYRVDEITNLYWKGFILEKNKN